VVHSRPRAESGSFLRSVSPWSSIAMASQGCRQQPGFGRCGDAIEV
jgi:hypothetical protein